MKWISTRIYQVLVKCRAGIRLLDILRGIFEFTKCLPGNLVFRYKNPKFPVPPLVLMFDANAHMNYQYYKASGEDAARYYSHLFRNHHRFSQNEETRILEWGCGPARIIRHLKDHHPQENIRLFGTDYNPRTINWCRKNIKGVEFQHNTLNPPLPFDDSSLDIVYCLSVFTHLSLDKTVEWLNELSRVTKPGGLISFTTQGDAYLTKMRNDEAALYLQGNAIVRGSEIEGKKYYSAFHPPKFIRDQLVKDYEILEELVIKTPEVGQDVWLIKNT